MLNRSTIQLLRFPFSFFLLPVYLFALSQTSQIDTRSTLLIFFILHLLVYPASNGYNSYMDRDTESIGGLKNPLQPTKQLFLITALMDLAAILLGLLVSIYFSIGIAMYILASRSYSYRGIRLKKYPIVGYLTVIVFQGAVIYWMVYHGSSINKTLRVPSIPAIASSLLVGGFYPLTQVYQHEADRKDGIKTISSLLGYKGTFLFCAAVYALAMLCLAFYFQQQLQLKKFIVLTTLLIPVLVYFFMWASKVWQDISAANFNNTMRMNVVASVSTNLAFAVLLTWRIFE